MLLIDRNYQIKAVSLKPDKSSHVLIIRLKLWTVALWLANYN